MNRLKRPGPAVDLRVVTIVIIRWLIKPFLQLFRWTLAIGLWLATLVVLAMGMAALARIFTGDPEFGALDGVQFTESLYTAVFRFIIVAVLVLLLQRTLRWRPTTRLSAILDEADAVREREAAAAIAEPAVTSATEAATESWPAPDPRDRRSGPADDHEPATGHEPTTGSDAHPDLDLDGDDPPPRKEKLKGRPRAWVTVD